MPPVIMNARVLLLPSNGQGRVAMELNQRLKLATIAPTGRFASGARGHLWEQVVLPARLYGRPLWSPSTSAPIAYPNQVVTIHDIGFVDAPQFFAPRFAAVYSFIVKRVAKSARHLVTVSEFTRQRLIDHYGVAPDRVTAILSGISDVFRVSSPAEIEAVLARHGLVGVPYLVGFSGSDPRKNTQGLLKAWAMLAGRRRGAKLVLFGRKSNASVFGANNESADETDVLRLGGVPDDELACLFGGSQGLVFPSFYEGFGLPVVEAVASGAPIITSNVTSLPEVAPAGGTLIDPGNPGEMAEAMLALLDATPDAVSRREAAAAIRRRFSWEAAAGQYRDLFARTFG